MDFYPRPPRGGRHNDAAVFRQHGEFLSTPSARRATRKVELMAIFSVISIHALREEGDLATKTTWRDKDDFYPRPPRGGRQALLIWML